MKHFLFFLFLLCANTTLAQKCIPFMRLDTLKTMMEILPKPDEVRKFVFVHTPDVYKTPSGVLYEVYTKKIEGKKIPYQFVNFDSTMRSPPIWVRNDVKTDLRLENPQYRMNYYYRNTTENPKWASFWQKLAIIYTFFETKHQLPKYKISAAGEYEIE
jgi:hypothetical protein